MVHVFGYMVTKSTRDSGLGCVSAHVLRRFMLLALALFAVEHSTTQCNDDYFFCSPILKLLELRKGVLYTIYSTVSGAESQKSRGRDGTRWNNNDHDFFTRTFQYQQLILHFL